MQTSPKSKHPPELLAKLHAMLQHNPSAIDFIVAYGEQAEIADDLADENLNKAEKAEKLQRLTNLSSRLYSSDYWHQNRAQLLMVEQLNNLTFFDTYKWEHSDEEWKRRDARALNHCAYNMLFAILILECGFDAARSISLEFRESAHRNQLDDMYERQENGR